MEKKGAKDLFSRKAQYKLTDQVFRFFKKYHYYLNLNMIFDLKEMTQVVLMVDCIVIYLQRDKRRKFQIKSKEKNRVTPLLTYVVPSNVYHLSLNILFPCKKFQKNYVFIFAFYL